MRIQLSIWLNLGIFSTLRSLKFIKLFRNGKKISRHHEKKVVGSFEMVHRIKFRRSSFLMTEVIRTVRERSFSQSVVRNGKILRDIFRKRDCLEVTEEYFWSPLFLQYKITHGSNLQKRGVGCWGNGIFSGVAPDQCDLSIIGNPVTRCKSRTTSL